MADQTTAQSTATGAAGATLAEQFEAVVRDANMEATMAAQKAEIEGLNTLVRSMQAQLDALSKAETKANLEAAVQAAAAGAAADRKRRHSFKSEHLPALLPTCS